MALSQGGANYANRRYIQGQDKYTAGALDDLASQIQTVADQTGANPAGIVAAPTQPAAITVTAAGGFGTVAVSDPNAADGTQYLLEYDTTPNFLSPIEVDLGIAQSWHGYLLGLTLYFRVAAYFPTSGLSAFAYFGPVNNPTAVTF